MGTDFGANFARKLRQCRPRPGDVWRLDEVFLRINGVLHYLWRAVNQHGVMLDILVQRPRETTAAKPASWLTERRAARARHLTTALVNGPNLQVEGILRLSPLPPL